MPKTETKETKEVKAIRYMGCLKLRKVFKWNMKNYTQRFYIFNDINS